MDKQEKINVQLYGGKSLFGGKETPLEADIIYCDRTSECTLFKNGKCLRCRMPFSHNCEFGRTSTIRGYTSRAAKYYSFRKLYENDPLYHKLDYPKALAARMGDTIYLDLKYVWVRKDDPKKTHSGYRVDGYVIDEVALSTSCVFMPIDDLTNAILHKIVSYRPKAFMGGEIKDYQAKIVPDMLQDLRKTAPELYARFVTEYPEYDFAPNYVGKAAYINSMKPGTKIVDHKGHEWLYNGEYLESDGDVDLSFGSPWCLSGGDKGRMWIKVTDKMTFKITDNSQVDENTRFE